MINEEIARRTLSLEMQVSKATGKEILKALKGLLHQLSEKKQSLAEHLSQEGSEMKLKDLVKKGQLEEIPLQEAELRELKKELNQHGVKFSVMYDKETKNHSVFFQSKDAKVMQMAFDTAVKKAERKIDRKASIRKALSKFKELAQNSLQRDKIKNKEKEQSL